MTRHTQAARKPCNRARTRGGAGTWGGVRLRRAAGVSGARPIPPLGAPMKRLLLALLPLAACTDDPKPIVTVAPASANVLTCSTTQLAATVTQGTDPSVTWSASPGTVDASGLYTSPMTTP